MIGNIHEAVAVRKFPQDIVYDEFPIQQYFVEKFLGATAPICNIKIGEVGKCGTKNMDG